LARGLSRNEEDFSDIRKDATLGMEKLFEEALQVSILVKRDMISVKLCVVLSPPPDIMPTIDLDRVDIQWPVRGGPPAQHVLGTYSLGLIKIDEFDHRTVLIRPRVITDQILHLTRVENVKLSEHGVVRPHKAPTKPTKPLGKNAWGVAQ
jgi:hypothetical protein